MISDHVEWWCDVRFFMVRIPEKSIQELEVGPHGVGNFQRFEGWKPTLKTSAWTWNRPLWRVAAFLLIFIEGILWPPGNATNIRGSNIWGSSGRRSLRHFSGPFTRWGFFARIRLSPSQGHKESAITWYFWKPFRTLRQLMGSSWVLRIWCI